MLFVCFALAASAQEISVSSFRILESDLTANTKGTMESDQNGEVAALIKVVTTEQGFVFDGGMVGIVKTRQGVGEVWVYVPHGIKRITVQHPQLGVLRDYYFPMAIEKAKTYEMKLTTGKVVTTVTRSAGKQYVMFTVNPPHALVELDGMPLEVSADGYAEKSMPYGTYDYRVSCANYHSEAGKLTVSSNGKVEMNVSLRPNFGWIDFRGADDYHGAHVYVDGERIGQLPLRSEAIKSGTHQVKVIKPLYKPYEQQVTVTDNNTTSLDVALVPNFANITFTTDAESEIWIDGRQRGKGTCTIGLEEGDYTIEVKRLSHRTVSEVITIASLAERTIQLPSPTPIYGVLDISSSPSRATVLVDGVEVGQTPLILDNVLVGNHELKFVKEGFVEQAKTLIVDENNTCQLKIVLSERPKEVEVKITSSPNHATVGVDGKEVGLTPLNLHMNVGNHDFSASKKGYYSPNLYGREVNSTMNNVHFDMVRIPKERPYVNKYFNSDAGYIEGNVETSNGLYGVGVVVGAYLDGLNAELALQKSTYNQFVMRMGVGCLLGKSFLITPQIGMNVFWGVPALYYDVDEWEDLGISLSCRIQYCLSKSVALSVTPEYIFYSMLEDDPDIDIIGQSTMGLYLRVGLVFNLD